MSRTIRKPYPSQLEGAILNTVKWGRFQYCSTTAYANHCPDKVGRYNARYKWPVPKWWDKLMHTRPRRAQERMAIRRFHSICCTGDDWYDVDDVWPLSKKPHQYYW